mgnify:CR=1 FL=1
MLYEAQGTVRAIFDTQQKTENFRLREFVIELQDGQYTEEVKFQLTQDRCPLVDKFGEGDEVKVAFSLKGRSVTSREGKTLYFTNLNAIRVEPDGDTVEDPNANQANQAGDPNQDIPPAGDQDDEELPF